MFKWFYKYKKSHELFNEAIKIAKKCERLMANNRHLIDWEVTDSYLDLAMRKISFIKNRLHKSWHDDIDEIVGYINYNYSTRHPMNLFFD